MAIYQSNLRAPDLRPSHQEIKAFMWEIFERVMDRGPVCVSWQLIIEYFDTSAQLTNWLRENHSSIKAELKEFEVRFYVNLI